MKPIMSQFAGKTTIVTGAARGMGRAVAVRLAQEGSNIVVNDIHPEGIEETVTMVKSLGTSAIGIPADVSSAEAVVSLVATAITVFQKIDILVNNAGILKPTKVVDIEEAEWDNVVNGSLKTTYLCSRAVLPSMLANKWGRIINFSSTAGKNVSTIGGAHYTASKAGILGFTRHLAKELTATGITVNAVCPGLVNTEMTRSTIGYLSAMQYAETLPVPRMCEPEEVAHLVAFLASEQAAYLTGASLDINGGELMV